MLSMLNLLCFGCSTVGQHVNGCILHVAYIIDLWTSNWIILSMRHFEKARLTSFFFSCFISSPIHICRGQTVNLACKTTGGEDTCLALTTIPFETRVDKSWKKIMPLNAYAKQFAEFPFLCNVYFFVYLCIYYNIHIQSSCLPFFRIFFF